MVFISNGRHSWYLEIRRCRSLAIWDDVGAGGLRKGTVIICARLYLQLQKISLKLLTANKDEVRFKVTLKNNVTGYGHKKEPHVCECTPTTPTPTMFSTPQRWWSQSPTSLRTEELLNVAHYIILHYMYARPYDKFWCRLKDFW